MSNRLGIAQSNRLRTYHMLKGQPERIIRASLGLQPHECHRAALERLRVALDRAPDPRPHAPKLERSGLEKGYNSRVLEILGEHYRSGEPLPAMKEFAKQANLSMGRISNITTLLQEEGRLELRVEPGPGRPLRYVEYWEPPL